MTEQTTPTPGRPAALDDILTEWHASSASQRDTVRRQFPELAMRIEAANGARLADIVTAWRRRGRQSVRDEITTAIPTLAAALRKAAVEPTEQAPAPFRGLSHVVEVWSNGSLARRGAVRNQFPALAEILDHADGYMQEIGAQQAVNECSPAPAPFRHADGYVREIDIDEAFPDNEEAPAPADDREPAHTVEVLDDMLRVATGGYGQSPSDTFGPGDWLNVAAYFAADAVTEKTALTEANGVGAAALTARNNCTAATGLAGMFAHLAVAACAVEGVRRGR